MLTVLLRYIDVSYNLSILPGFRKWHGIEPIVKLQVSTKRKHFNKFAAYTVNMLLKESVDGKNKCLNMVSLHGEGI